MVKIKQIGIGQMASGTIDGIISHRRLNLITPPDPAGSPLYKGFPANRGECCPLMTTLRLTAHEVTPHKIERPVWLAPYLAPYLKRLR